MIEFLSQPWHWSVSGAAIAGIMLLLLWFGGEFGVSSNLRTMCAISGAGERHAFFRFDWKDQSWNLVFVVGAVIGGWIAVTALGSPEPVQIAESTQRYLQSVSIDTPEEISEGRGYVPQEILAPERALSGINLLILIAGGFMVGFGARYAGGCTSGHAISGLSNLQLSSLIAVVGFFIGGPVMAWGILPIILTL